MCNPPLNTKPPSFLLKIQYAALPHLLEFDTDVGVITSPGTLNLCAPRQRVPCAFEHDVTSHDKTKVSGHKNMLVTCLSLC